MVLRKNSTLSLALILTGAAATGCGSKSSSDPATAAPTTGAPTTSGSDEEPPTAALADGSALMGAIGGALASVPGSLLISNSLRLSSSASGDVNCTEHGDPLKPGFAKAKGAPILQEDMLDHSDAAYPSKLFLCLATLSAEKGASVETLLGSIAQVQSVLCSFEKGFGTIEYTTAGNDLIAGTPKTIDLVSECWPNGAPEGITSVKFDSAMATALDASTGYEKELKFASTEADVDYTLRFFNKDGIIGFKKIEAPAAPAVGGYSELVLDSNNGVILVNTVDDRGGSGGADSAYRRVVRMKVAGELDSDLKFTSLTGLQGIRANSGNFAENPDHFDGATLIGDATKGYYGQTVRFDGTAFGTGGYAGCTGANADCTAAGLLYTTTNGPVFYNSRTEWAAHRDTGLPPCDDGVDISFAAVPKTGAFGKCAE